MPAWYIATRAEFAAVLARTLELAHQRRAASQLWVHASIAAQLAAMTEWTAAGRVPTSEERGRITVGLLAIRELDPEPMGEEASYVESLLQLAGYFERWPPDPPVAAERTRVAPRA